MGLKLVPFNAVWVSHDKIDVHAIYRRPRFVEDEYGELQREYDATGMPTWDLTGPLPVRQHTKWVAKGFEYITLANKESLAVAAVTRTLPPGTTMADFDQHQTGGPWSFRKYQESAASNLATESAQLKQDVEEFGSAAVETIKRRENPNFQLPVALRGIKPRETVAAAAEPEKKSKGAAA